MVVDALAQTTRWLFLPLVFAVCSGFEPAECGRDSPKQTQLPAGGGGEALNLPVPIHVDAVPPQSAVLPLCGGARI